MTKIIAEIGWNHMGDMELAKKMIKAAHESGASYAKFQTWSVSRLRDGEWDSDGRRQIYEKAELSKEDHVLLIDYCKEVGIKFLSSVFSVDDAMLLVSLGVEEVKIPSFECRNEYLIKYCNDHFKTVYMSTGTSKWSELKDSVELLPNTRLVLMHCVSSYPAEYSSANISKLRFLKMLGSNIGNSDHIFGVESCKVAMAYGVEVIEKHFTIDRDLPGRDNKFAILPEEMKQLSDYIKLHDDMHVFHGLDFQPCEESSRDQYAGRFNK